MLLKPSRVCSSLFSFKNNMFSTEISDLGPSFNFGRVYDDAADLGFTIISKVTGNAAVFALNKELSDGEGDVQGWEFVCVTSGLKQLKAVIFND
jgi:hypothetical protein